MFENKALIVTRCQRRFFVFFRILFMLYDESALSGLFGLFSPNWISVVVESYTRVATDDILWKNSNFLEIFVRILFQLLSTDDPLFLKTRTFRTFSSEFDDFVVDDDDDDVVESQYGTRTTRCRLLRDDDVFDVLGFRRNDHASLDLKNKKRIYIIKGYLV